MAEYPLFKIRTMTPDDLDQAFSLSLSEGWNQTMRDWNFFLGNSKNICIAAEKDNRIAGTAAALVHDDKVAWIGMVLVDKSLRGLGAGKMLLENITGRLSHVASVKLDATPAGEPLYTKLGFRPEHKIFRMTSQRLNLNSIEKGSDIIHAPEKQNIWDIIDYDRIVFGAGRNDLILNLTQDFPGKSFFHLSDNKVDGFIMGRDGSKFNYVGPLSAESETSAILLLSEALKSLPDHPVAIDIMEDKKEIIEWLETVGFVKQRHFVRMYLKSNPYPGRVSSQYLISGPEFG